MRREIIALAAFFFREQPRQIFSLKLAGDERRFWRFCGESKHNPSVTQRAA